MISDSVARKKAKSFGAFYTPEELSLWLVGLVKKSGFKPKIILDPSAGGGALLESAGRVFPRSKLQGFDLEPGAHSYLLKKGWGLLEKPTDALLVDKWQTSQNQQPQLIYSNPPWGAKLTPKQVRSYRNKFTLAQGSFDTFDLFVEKILTALQIGDWAALFLPDSLLLESHKKTRMLIQRQTRIHHAIRLPEGAFLGVAMGSIALVLEKGEPKSDFKIEVSRLQRKDFLSNSDGAEGIENLRVKSASKINQRNWADSDSANWNFSVRENIPEILPNHLFHFDSATEGSSWDQWFTSGRGLELGKSSLDLATTSKRKLRVAVGEDVSRRIVEPSREMNLQTQLRVNLKAEVNSGKRLLVRKTGIGIKAAVADNVVTTQTIYHFKARKAAPGYALHYAAGFLTSRVVIAIHLAKTGETEWRSHPYVTQKTIRDLQIPIPKAGSRQELIAKQIAKLSEELHRDHDIIAEERLDLLVCKLLEVGPEVASWALDFLSGVSGCTYTKELAGARKKELTA